MFPKLSVAIITLNEVRNITRLLPVLQKITPSLEIILVDSGSTDGTLDIAAAYGAKVYHQPWLGFSGQKNVALSHCQGEYILSLDADEVPDSTLISALQAVLEEGSEGEAYCVSRHAVYMGRLMKHAFCDTKLRFVKASSHPRWEGEFVHEALYSEAKQVKTLPGILMHYSYEDFADHLKRSIAYSRLSALKKQEQGERFSLFKLLCNPFFAFFKSYVLKCGFLDGLPGFVVSKMRALDVFEKYLFLYELSQQRDTPSKP